MFDDDCLIIVLVDLLVLCISLLFILIADGFGDVFGLFVCWLLDLLVCCFCLRLVDWFIGFECFVDLICVRLSCCGCCCVVYMLFGILCFG